MDFHKHLDECIQCREHPFDLCPIGIKLLKAVVLDADREMLDEDADYFEAADIDDIGHR